MSREKSDLLGNLRTIMTVERSRRWTTMHMQTRKVSSFIAERGHGGVHTKNEKGVGLRTF
jgi:hypothetical protein